MMDSLFWDFVNEDKIVICEQYPDLLKNPDRTQGNCEKSAKDPEQQQTVCHDLAKQLSHYLYFFYIYISILYYIGRSAVMGIKRFDHETKVKTRSEKWNL